MLLNVFYCLESTDETPDQSTDVVCFPVVVRSSSNPEGCYELTYTLHKPGSYQLTIRQDGRHISGSPFTLVASDKYLHSSEFASPGVSQQLAANHRLYDTHRRMRASANINAPQSSSVANGKSPCGATKRPASSPPSNRSCSLARPRTARINATSPTRCGGATSSQFNCTSKLQSKRRDRSASGHLNVTNQATPVKTVECNNKNWHVDNNVATMDCDVTGAGDQKNLILRVGRQGRNKGEFVNPQGVCCTKDGLVAVADSNSACVQVSKYSTLVRAFNFA